MSQEVLLKLDEEIETGTPLMAYIGTCVKKYIESHEEESKKIEGKTLERCANKIIEKARGEAYRRNSNVGFLPDWDMADLIKNHFGFSHEVELAIPGERAFRASKEKILPAEKNVMDINLDDLLED